MNKAKELIEAKVKGSLPSIADPILEKLKDATTILNDQATVVKALAKRTKGSPNLTKKLNSVVGALNEGRLSDAIVLLENIDMIG